VADNPQQTVRELQELVVAYAKQETVEPLKGMVRYAGFGIAGALLLGVGVAFMSVGMLRGLQNLRGWGVHGNWSWVPYAAVVVTLTLLASLVWLTKARQSRRPERSNRA
jgi:Putative Actinobacterial Holin-X, holin superfamily III